MQSRAPMPWISWFEGGARKLARKLGVNAVGAEAGFVEAGFVEAAPRSPSSASRAPTPPCYAGRRIRRHTEPIQYPASDSPQREGRTPSAAAGASCPVRRRRRA